jgi:Glycosyltransferase family 87
MVRLTVELVLEPSEELLPPPLARLNWKVVLVSVLLVAASAEYVVRGPMRFFKDGSQWSDITQVDIPSRAWIRGIDPYSPKNFAALARQATGDSPTTANIGTHSPYPLTTLVIVSPIAALPWSIAHMVWTLIQGFSVLPIILSLASFGGLATRLHKCLFAALTLALAPLHTGIAVANVSIPAIALCCVAVWAASQGKETAAGILLGVATCLKPQLGLWFILYYLLRKRWRIVLVVASVGAFVLMIGLLRLEVSGVAWWQDYLSNARGFALDNKTVDFTGTDPIRFTLINVQVLFYILLGSTTAAEAGALLTGAALVGSWIWLGFRRQSRIPELLLLSSMVVLSLLPTYHRNYDATLLVFPLCWVLSRARFGKLEWLPLLFMLPFAIPGAVLLQTLADDGRIPGSMATAWWWNTLVMPHEIWALLLLSLLLLHAVSLSRSDTNRVS